MPQNEANASGTGSLRQQLLAAQFESPNRSNIYFVPVNKIQSLVNEQTVARELRKASSHMRNDPSLCNQHTEAICSHSKRIFAVLIRSGTVSEDTLSIVGEQVTDGDLPFCRGYSADSESYVLCGNTHEHCRSAEHLSCGIKAVSKLAQEEIAELDRLQWWVQAPEFLREADEIPHLELSDNIVMPFTRDFRKENLRTGGYSEVWSVRIHPAHQNLLQSNNDLVRYPIQKTFADVKKAQGPLVAVKRLMSGKDTDFKMETDFLADLTKRKHPHLVRLLATYRLQGKYHLMFPYARANLRQHWYLISLPYWNRPTAIWFLCQINGLVSALNAIHNFNTGKRPESQNVQTAATRATGYQALQIKVQKEKYGRHGDLKPENILWFSQRDSADPGGILQIADFGLGRFHGMESRSRQDPAMINGSPTYTPPEIFLRQLVSRAYDIWSFGCIFLEFITWLLEGSSGLEKFNKMRELKAVDKVVDDVYYTLSYPGNDTDQVPDRADVRQGVIEWIGCLRKSPRHSEMSVEFLNLIERRMVLVDSKERIGAESLASEVNRMLEKGERDLQYLLGDNPAVIDAHPGIKEPKE
jgi:serine/threonine protein kinase